jgi:hypothetical protein
MENFRRGRLLYRTFVQDEEGRFWKHEARQCRQTGVILKLTKRVTD